MYLEDTILDVVTIVAFIVMFFTLVKINRKDDKDPEKSEAVSEEVAKEIAELRELEKEREFKFREKIRILACLVALVSLGSRVMALANVHTDDKFKTVYSNSLNAEVSYYHHGTIFTGGQDINSINSANDLVYKAGIAKSEDKLVLKKNNTTVTRNIDHFELKGDKSGKVVRIDYGKRTRYNRIFGMTFERDSESVVKISLKESKSVSKDRAELNKLLEIKE